MEMRGVNGGSCRRDTPAQNSLLLQEETEEPFSDSSSLFFPLPRAEMCHYLRLSPPLSLWNALMPLLPLCFTPMTSTPPPNTHTLKWPLTSFKISHLPVCAWNSEEPLFTNVHIYAHKCFFSYPTVPPCSHPRVQREKKHSTTAWRSSAGDAKRACREAQARSASLEPSRPVEFSSFKTNTRPEKTESNENLSFFIHI